MVDGSITYGAASGSSMRNSSIPLPSSPELESVVAARMWERWKCGVGVGRDGEGGVGF